MMQRRMMWNWMVVLISFCCATVAGAGEESKATDAYFPLTPGTSWKYLVTIKADKAEPQMTAQTVTVESQQHDGKAVMVASDNAYAAQEDGVYIVGVVRNGKIERLEEPQKVVPANPKQGDAWTYREAAGVTSATVLGMEKVKTAAGEYEAAKIYLVTVGGTDQNERKETFRWFAQGVGPVKGSVTQQRPNADGTMATIEISMELTAFTRGGKGKEAKAMVAGGDKTGSADAQALFAQAQAAARLGDHKTALAKYDAAIAADPKSGKLHAYKTLSLIATRQFDAGEAEINRAVALDDKDYTFMEIAGQLRIAEGKIAEGKALYDKAAALSSANAGAIYMDLAAALAARKEDNKLAPEIDKALKAAVAANPPSPQALFALGQSYASAGRPEGRQYLQRYVEVASALPADKRDDRQIRLARQLIRALDVVKGAP